MVLTRVHLLFGLLAVWLPQPGHSQSGGNGIESLIRLLSPELRRIEKRLGEIEREMEPLPEVKEEPWGSRYGHRSADLPSETTPDWLQLDLRRDYEVDMVALMPVNLAYRGSEGAGYGFPKRFRVEIADNPDMRDSQILVDQSGEDIRNPGKYPLIFEFEPAAGRYLRITSLKHSFEKEAYFWALEELMVMNKNLTVHTGSRVSSSSNLNLFPLWSLARIVDGQSTMGMPVDITTPSPSQGYLSDRINIAAVGKPPSIASKKWCAVDLGKPQVIDQVRLLPLESDAYEVFGGRGFPRQLRVQLANDSGFKKIIWESKIGNLSLGYPDGCSITTSVAGVEAQYVRVLADDMWARDNWRSFGLAELQVYSTNHNVALGKAVYVSDSADKPRDAGWAPAYLVDGYTSRYRLIEWPEYLRLMEMRGVLTGEKIALNHLREDKLSRGKQILLGTTISLAVLVVTAWIWGIVRHRLLRRREAERLRQQIARDLHDDIGSNLGGIILLSEMGSQHSQDKESRDDFKSIHQVAEEASLSIRDIVWLIQRDRIGLKDFVTRMRQSLRMIINHADVSLEVEPAVFRDRPLDLTFRRHVFLAYKEVLNNVRKHAQTDRVTVKVEILTDRLRFTVRDQGIGFNPEDVSESGHGMTNMKRRASRVSGSIHIDSKPGKGSKIIFEAPFSK